ncbi:Lipoprotein signal peptidase [Roseovarius gaetbuli]|uniref:Lipoprotein signal peptidase n=1 Tax=Roseovarius gaetbuli TaxID=1356575 RepID=A0A1X6ZCV5_9RHOB|nr:signal peptidase II [Roseovarius gaetbuli]SLN47665.1 Lipoprotein signal peptidase [Roseovarius gaetbuli]
MRIVFWTGFWVFLLDQASKYLVVHTLSLRQLGAIDVWPPLFNLRMAWNYGINFGLMAGDNPLTRWVLIAVALVISSAVLWWVHTDPAGRWQKIAAGLLVGGALGNVIDRLIYGAVADFINVSCCGIDNPFAFNIADIAVFIGAFGMVLLPSGKKPS